MKKLILLPLLVALCMPVVAQNWVTIPDDNFANKLNELFPECMDGNLINTECPDVLNSTELDVSESEISDLTGIEIFTALEVLNCSYNYISSLPSLNESLQFLDCSGNQLSELPDLPATLTELRCRTNNLINLPELPPLLTELRCQQNNLSALPELPNTIEFLRCYQNNLTELPELPDSLYHLLCYSNDLISLPDLPAGLSQLWCYSNSLTSLPALPDSLTFLFCAFNNLTSLPELPGTLTTLLCHQNEISCFPTLPNSLEINHFDYLNIYDNPFTCLPNYVPAMSGSGFNSDLLSYPLCDPADLENNPYGCISLEGIDGIVFSDINNSCEQNEVESPLTNIPLQLLDDEGNLLSSTHTFTNGNYNFAADPGAYSVKLLHENLPFQPSCVDPGDTQEVILTEAEYSASDTDFGLECLSDYDLGSQSITPIGWVFPGQSHLLNFSAGDMSSWYDLQCADGVNGSVTVNITGPVNYIGPANGTLVPTETGDLQLTYEIDDFGDVIFDESFYIFLEPDTTAQAEDLICVEVIVEPIEDDAHPENNVYTHCYEVFNSYDPNIKQVWPQNVEPGYDDYFNYTIYFQNTGSAPAFNIRVADTLDANLDLSTFEVTAYSHECLTYVSGNVATFRFNDIMLPDSTSDFDGSIGHVQYRIKPVADLPVGTVIENTAHIYFDFNDAIVTNTTENLFEITTSVAEQTKQQVQVFPNPGTGMYNVSFKNAAAGTSTMEVFTLSGVRVAQQPLNSRQTVLDLTDQPPGMYLLRVQNEIGSEVVKIVKH